MGNGSYSILTSKLLSKASADGLVSGTVSDGPVSDGPAS